MARKNVQKVIAAFLQGKKTPQAAVRPNGRGVWSSGDDSYRNALWTDGDKIYSYRMIIAERLDDGSIRIVPRAEGPSCTTRAHIDGIRWGLTAEPIVAVAKERVEEIEREEREKRTPVGPADWLDGEVRDRCAAE